MNTERPSGYYWIIYDNKTWEVAQWEYIDQRWRRCFELDTYQDYEFDEINEIPIKPPKY